MATALLSVRDVLPDAGSTLPSALAVDGSGRVRAARAGRLAPADLDGVIAALP